MLDVRWEIFVRGTESRAQRYERRTRRARIISPCRRHHAVHARKDLRHCRRLLIDEVERGILLELDSCWLTRCVKSNEAEWVSSAWDLGMSA
jgi:hypothetical protein